MRATTGSPAGTAGSDTGGIGDARLRLRVSGRDDVAAEVLVLTLQSGDGSDLPAWTPGAHLEIRLPSGLTRQYSLCSDPRDRSSYGVSVLHEVNGRGGSREIHRNVQVGTELDVRPPRNHFPLVDADRYLLVAGGIGITPLKAMAEELERRGTHWSMVYGGRSLASMAFAQALQALGGDRVRLVPQDTEGLPDLAAVVAGAGPQAQIYCCGPVGLLDAIAGVCAAAGAGGRLHVERFTGSGTVVAEPGDQSFEVELARSGRVLRVRADQSILGALQEAGDEVDFSCAEGYCGSCETTVLAGRPEHRGTLMSPEEHDEEGTMLICVGRSRSPRLVLDR